MDYHDLTMLDLERAAEDRLYEAALALRNGDASAAREVERWSITLENIRELKTSLRGPRPQRDQPQK